MSVIKTRIGIAVLLLAGCVTSQAQGQQYSWQHLPQVNKPVFKKDTINILKYGAKADGITLNTTSINKAISACSAKGGGVVLIPQGLWLTGPLVMKSNVNLHVSRAALLQFTDDKTQYKLVEGNYEGHAAVRNESPISGTNLTNIAITGEGIIDGHGEVWRAISKDRLTEAEWKKLVASGGEVSENGRSWYPSESYVKGLKAPGAGVIGNGKTIKDNEPFKDFFRPNMLVLTNCKKVLLQGVTLQNSPAWDIHTLLCEDLTVQNARVRNPWNAQNGDGIDVESCRNVLIEGSTFDAGDDGICIKSGRDEEGRKRGKPTENVIVRNNVVYRAHGGFVIGSEMSGGARNIFVSNCTFIGTDIGLRFKTTRGRGGVVENIFIKNISMKEILHEAILFDMYYGGKSPGEADDVNDQAVVPVTEATPSFRKFYVDNVVCNGAEKALMIRGLPEMGIKDIHIENSTFKTVKGADVIEAQNISLKNIHLESKDTNPLINIQNSSNLTFDHITYGNTEQLLKISGKKSQQIKLLNTDAAKARKKVEYASGATENALTGLK
ncbi:glycoside hydrolase family 28 protein [Mucilaginibacter sp. cycad4]|uniref:glycoside hydrolase family 28 protein n=1 Tax=Mucilaginibacter sp. cycad4 TaxID=3342096 RepID=UPI002AAC3DF8|nr:glycoside hydrolase family 28 protein [Mucilaginibacter gossypii]WPU97473.1 glycoside hydrolase family 28 protein [Mucilaginibacter gossypii]